MIEHPENLSVADLRHRDVLDAIALVAARLSRLQELLDKIALGLGVTPDG
jgi:hypothetical protein